MNKTKRKIFNAAIELFSKNGYDNATVDDITAIAGVAKGSLIIFLKKKIYLICYYKKGLIYLEIVLN